MRRRAELAEELRQLRHTVGVIARLADEENVSAGNATPSERLSAIRRTLGVDEPRHKHRWVSLRTVGDAGDPQMCADCGATQTLVFF